MREQSGLPETPLAHVINRLRASEIVTEPYPHYYLEKVFPEAYYQALLDHLPDSTVYENLYEVTTLKLDHFRHRDQRDLNEGWTSALPEKLKGFWDGFDDWFLSQELAQAVLDSFAEPLRARFGERTLWPSPSVESQLIRHRGGYFLGPHSDAHTKLVVLMIYLAPDESAAHLGTSLYRPKDSSFSCPNSTHYPFEDFVNVKTAPYKPNSLLAFLRSDISFHGVEPLSDQDVTDCDRDVIQYVVYDKAAREEQLRARRLAAARGECMISHQQEMRRIVFVSRQMVGESLRVARAIGKLDGVIVFGVCEDLPDGMGIAAFADVVQVTDTHDIDQLIIAANMLAEKHGLVDRIVTATETLLDPVARASERLGLQGMSVDTVRRALDKSCLKATLEQSGINTARDQILTSSEDARDFVAQVGFPIVLKPLSGSGALATLCVRSADQLELALELMQPSLAHAVLAEDYLGGEELCIDTITIANEPQFFSICCYYPSILEAVEDPRIQWTCVMPRDISGDRYRDFIEQGLQAVRALSVGNAMTHMEGFMAENGKPCFTDATLRPAGARIGPMLAFAYDIDPYLAWARVAIDGSFDGPWERKYAVGTVFLRGTGSGAVKQVHGIEEVRQETGHLLVESRLPRIGAPKSDTYTGDGYVTIRHPDTRVVEDTLRWIAETIRITYTQPTFNVPVSLLSTGQWSQRLKDFDRRLNRPAWDDDSLPSLSQA